MDKLKFSVVSIIILSLLVLGGYWALATMQSGSEYVSNQKLKALENENADLKKEIEQLKNNLNTIKPIVEDAKPVEPKVQPPTTPIKKPAPVTAYKNQTLINELQKLVNDNITLKLKSSGTRVGTVQKFLNIYNKTSNRVDNDYGASTEKAVMAFQKAVGLTADGEAGPGTFKKMIDWLKKQG